MAPPTKVQIQALRKDAKMWDGGDESMATVMGDAKTSASSVYVPFPEIASDLHTTYLSAQDKVVKLLGQGKTQFEGISTALSTAANVYEGTDTENADLIHRNWEAK